MSDKQAENPNLRNENIEDRLYNLYVLHMNDLNTRTSPSSNRGSHEIIVNEETISEHFKSLWRSNEMKQSKQNVEGKEKTEIGSANLEKVLTIPEYPEIDSKPLVDDMLPGPSKYEDEDEEYVFSELSGVQDLNSTKHKRKRNCFYTGEGSHKIIVTEEKISEHFKSLWRSKDIKQSKQNVEGKEKTEIGSANLEKLLTIPEYPEIDSKPLVDDMLPGPSKYEDEDEEYVFSELSGVQDLNSTKHKRKRNCFYTGEGSHKIIVTEEKISEHFKSLWRSKDIKQSKQNVEGKEKTEIGSANLEKLHTIPEYPEIDSKPLVDDMLPGPSKKRKMDQQIPLTLPIEANPQRASIFDGVINMNMNMDNIGAGDRSVWVQVPPQTMPWGTPANQLPNVIRFTGDIDINTSSSSSVSQSSEDSVKSQSYYKRKSSDFGPRIPKMLVTEDMMADQLRNMYISKCKVEEPSGNEEAIGEMSEMDNDQGLPVLTVCSEIKHMIPVCNPTISVPRTLLENMETPSRALVLWKPPKGILESTLQESAASLNTSSSEHDSCTSSESKRKQPETIYTMDN